MARGGATGGGAERRAVPAAGVVPGWGWSTEESHRGMQLASPIYRRHAFSGTRGILLKRFDMLPPREASIASSRLAAGREFELRGLLTSFIKISCRVAIATAAGKPLAKESTSDVKGRFSFAAGDHVQTRRVGIFRISAQGDCRVFKSLQMHLYPSQVVLRSQAKKGVMIWNLSRAGAKGQVI